MLFLLEIEQWTKTKYLPIWHLNSLKGRRIVEKFCVKYQVVIAALEKNNLSKWDEMPGIGGEI